MASNDLNPEYLLTPSSSSSSQLETFQRHQSANSSSGDLSSNYFDGGPESSLKIVKPPSYMATHTPISSDEFSTTRLSSIRPLEHKTSIFGPTASPQQRTMFLVIISLMTFCGANNDFLGKLCYQSLPGVYSGYIGLQNRYWIAWLLTFSTFLVCSMALAVGWDGGREYKRMRKDFRLFMFNVSIPGIHSLQNEPFLIDCYLINLNHIESVSDPLSDSNQRIEN